MLPCCAVCSRLSRFRLRYPRYMLDQITSAMWTLLPGSVGEMDLQAAWRPVRGRRDGGQRTCTDDRCSVTTTIRKDQCNTLLKEVGERGCCEDMEPHLLNERLPAQLT